MAARPLPNELLSHIFYLGCQDELDLDSLPPNTPRFEVLVSHVCQHWRNVALATSALWTTIHFRTNSHRDRANQYLARSKQNLIDISVDTTSEKDHISGKTLFREEFKPVFEIVTPHINRWKSLTLKVRDLTCKRYAREVLSTCGSATRLESLQLWHIEEWGTAERLFTAIGPPPVLVFEGSLPALKHISLIGVNLPWTHSRFLEGLETIDFALHSDDVRIPYDLWHRMLSRSPDLWKLSLHYSGPKIGGGPVAAAGPPGAGLAVPPSLEGEEEWGDERIRLMKLKDVQLVDLDPGYLVNLFRRLEMPNVTKLKVELHDQPFTEFVDYLVCPPSDNRYSYSSPNGHLYESDSEQEAVPRGPVFPNLNTLIVVALECSVESWKSLLRTSVEIENLEVDFAEMDEGCFDVLFQVDDQQVPQHSNRIVGGKGNGHGDVMMREAVVGNGNLNGNGKERAGGPIRPNGATTSSSSTSYSYTTHQNPPYSSSHSLSSSRILLPHLQSLKFTGDSLTPQQIQKYILFRRQHGRPLKKWMLDERLKEDMEKWVKEMGLESDLSVKGWEEMERVVWVSEAEDDDDEVEEESDVYVEEEEVEEDAEEVDEDGAESD
ncbi:hypothetical protein NLI96_g1440 [Meripilus lineatus]|uniref:F-box domain-containing protein n=1 Tax=Meripilus lineatus TaxID=2056292 RepID=A0AAD5VA59_9APHY|nr:hypothetical protein NLI96_g1440 [Physisporinus lineatus]